MRRGRSFENRSLPVRVRAFGCLYGRLSVAAPTKLSFLSDLALCSGRVLEIIGLHLSYYNIRLRLDVRQHWLRINANPKDQRYQLRELPRLSRVQVSQPFVSFVGHLPEKDSL